MQTLKIQKGVLFISIRHTCQGIHQIGLLGAFYLQPLSKPKGDTWFSKVPCGHNTLQKIVPELMKAAGFSGYFTNHSLRASAAT